MNNAAFIGLGAMGAPMAWNLYRAGFALTVWNRTGSRSQPFAGSGVEVAESPAAAARGKDAVVIMVSDPAALRAVLAGERGVASALEPNALVINMSTVSHAATDGGRRIGGGTWRSIRRRAGFRYDQARPGRSACGAGRRPAR